MQDEIALDRSATARARTLLDGRPVTIRRVGCSYNRTIAQVTLAGHYVGSELGATGVARFCSAGSASPGGARTC